MFTHKSVSTNYTINFDIVLRFLFYGILTLVTCHLFAQKIMHVRDVNSWSKSDINNRRTLQPVERDV